MIDITKKPQTGLWPVEAVFAGAGFDEIVGAPGNGVSYYLTGYSGYSTNAQSFSLLRRSYKTIAAVTAEFTMADNAALEPGSGDFGFSFWIKTSAVSCLTIQKGDPAATDGYEIAIDSSGKVKVTFQDDGAATATKTSSTAITNNQWHHICIVIDRDGDSYIYLDGSADCAAWDVSALTGSVTGGATNLTFTGGASAGCSISTFAIYKAGTPTVADEWNDGIGRKLVSTDTYLSVGYNTDEGEGTTGYDVGGTVNITYATAAAWGTGGIPIDTNDPDGNLDLVDDVLRTSSTTDHVTFPHAIKIGRHCPINLVASGAMTVRLFGFADSY